MQGDRHQQETASSMWQRLTAMTPFCLSWGLHSLISLHHTSHSPHRPKLQPGFSTARICHISGKYGPDPGCFWPGVYSGGGSYIGLAWHPEEWDKNKPRAAHPDRLRPMITNERTHSSTSHPLAKYCHVLRNWSPGVSQGRLLRTHRPSWAKPSLFSDIIKVLTENYFGLFESLCSSGRIIFVAWVDKGE